MRNKFFYLIATCLIFICQSAHAQNWQDALDLQQSKIILLMEKIQESAEKLQVEEIKDCDLNLAMTINLRSDIVANLTAVHALLANLRTQKMLFERVTVAHEVDRAKKILRIQNDQFIKELSIRERSIQQKSKFAKTSETTQHIFEAYDILKSTKEIISTKFNY